jgi:hypothetical protein
MEIIIDNFSIFQVEALVNSALERYKNNTSDCMIELSVQGQKVYLIAQHNGTFALSGQPSGMVLAKPDRMIGYLYGLILQ